MSNNLSKIRGKHQATLERLAKQTGCTKQAIHCAENGKLSYKLAKKIAGVLGENVFELLGSDAFVALPETEEEKAILIRFIKEL